MTFRTHSNVAEIVRHAAQPLRGVDDDYDTLLDLVGDARFVLIGEASHGTHEFYQARADITRRLIAEKGFTAVVVEADWPDAYRVNRFVRGTSDDATAEQALGNFQRFPIWMWRNTVVRDFVSWLRDHNAVLPADAPRVGFYGMDLYSLNTSVDEVIRYLETTDPEAARRARDRYSCFEQFSRDPQRYGYLATFGRETCEEDVVAQLVEIQRRAAELSSGDGRIAEDAHFHAEQNARLVKNAEQYYRAMFYGHDESWNLRDTHMADTIDALAAHLEQSDAPSRLVVWAHNSHLGDARATEMGLEGEINVGQLVRERHPGETVNIGFTTYTGTVTAASDWDEPPQRKRVRPGLRDSYEDMFHAVGLPSFLLRLRDGGPAADALRAERLERAIGVIYAPQTERQSHYFHARLPDQFDAVLHFDETHALESLDRQDGRGRALGARQDEPPETYPFGQ
jgi:erythromycin esterase-like protein